MRYDATMKGPVSSDAIVSRAAIRHIAWFLSACAVGFAVPFVFSSLLDLESDVYYLIYFSVALALIAAYVRTNRIDVVRLFSQSAIISLIVGAVVAVFLVANVLSRDETPRPDGLYFIWTVGWRGVVYGIVDALLLSALPAAVAFALFREDLHSAPRRISFAALVIVFSMAITATYHLGYEQFRDDGVGQPEIGNVLITSPAALTGNPIGSLVAHVAMHVTADVHVYETDVFLPPQTDAEE